MECKQYDVLIDSNILMYLDSVEDSSECLRERAFSKIKEIHHNGQRLFFSLTVYREVSVGVAKKEDLDELCRLTCNGEVEENKDIAFLAGKRYMEYLKDLKSNRNTSDLPIKRSKTIPNDCMIGATALYHGLAILTNNGSDFRKYFPELDVIEI